MQKRKNPIELELPSCTYKSSKYDCSGEVKISWIMSTDRYHLSFYALLQSFVWREIQFCCNLQLELR